MECRISLFGRWPNLTSVVESLTNQVWTFKPDVVTRNDKDPLPTSTRARLWTPREPTWTRSNCRLLFSHPRLLAAAGKTHFYFQIGGTHLVHTDPSTAPLTPSVMRVLPALLYREMLISQPGFSLWLTVSEDGASKSACGELTCFFNLGADPPGGGSQMRK